MLNYSTTRQELLWSSGTRFLPQASFNFQNYFSFPSLFATGFVWTLDKCVCEMWTPFFPLQTLWCQQSTWLMFSCCQNYCGLSVAWEVDSQSLRCVLWLWYTISWKYNSSNVVQWLCTLDKLRWFLKNCCHLPIPTNNDKFLKYITQVE